MRGSVTAGMACAINDLGVADAFDLVLGSSAGSIVGSYLVARADHRTTYQFFCNYLTTSKNHLNGTSWLDISRLTKLLSPIRPDFSPKSPVMLLEYPMKHIMQELLPLNWTVFERNNKHQPMKVIASGLFSQGPVILGTEEDSFNDLSSLCDCIKASCMLPGIAGIQPIWIKGSSSRDPENLKQGEVSDSLASFVPEVEPLVDALVYEPIPYRSALSSGCSHVLVLRSYPDGNLMPKSLLGIFERLIAPKCLDPFPKVKKHLHDAGHSIIYAKDILLLNQQASKGLVSNQAADEGRQEEETDPRLFAIAPLDVDDVISQLALDRNVLLAGILQGFVRAYDILGDPSRSLTGAERAIDLF
uniref:PNPLA domain-containing protein n=1 Tax=Guillardia theta (strain CCMP2712) TaxID=905079 RepID=A0A0C3U766_GUITC